MSVLPALITAAMELGLHQNRFKDSYVAWLNIYTSTGVDPIGAPCLAAERAISQLMANVAQHHQINP